MAVDVLTFALLFAAFIAFLCAILVALQAGKKRAAKLEKKDKELRELIQRN